jgi:hypothetical protein
MVKKINNVLGALAALTGITSIIQGAVFSYKISSKTIITLRIRKSVFPKELFERILFNAANDIWLLGKNNIICFGACRYCSGQAPEQKIIRCFCF